MTFNLGYTIKSFKRCARTGTRILTETDIDRQGKPTPPERITLAGPDNLELELVADAKEYK